MWPRILLELLPHFSRLMPAADKFLTSRTASDKAQEAALAALANEVRGELGQVSDGYEGLRRQLQEQTTQVTQMGVEMTRTRLGVESVEERVAKLEKTATALMRMLVAALVGLAGVAAMLVVLLIKVKGH